MCCYIQLKHCVRSTCTNSLVVKRNIPWFILEQTNSRQWILALSAKGSLPSSQFSYIMCIYLPVLKDPWQLQVVIQVFSLGTKDLIKKMHEPKADFFSSLPDLASGCSIPWGQKPQMICVSSKSSLEETKLISNELKNLFFIFERAWGSIFTHSLFFQILPKKNESQGGPGWEPAASLVNGFWKSVSLFFLAVRY